MAELTPLPIYQNAPLDETQVYQSDNKFAIFGPDPLSDPQIDPLRPHLEKFSACGAQRVPAALPLRGGPTAAEGMRCSTAHAIPRLWQMGPYFFKPAAPGRAGQGKKVFFS